ncbi:MAG: succinate dehydrogenase, hydrophobic membrane anchor protein [Thermomonas sp.]|nr:succinate dehydrogenase, hydrophobic membrane anchor protein [Thermomonas sp.]MDI1253296.1 succinate dehydrogenase, hydrophobic membrane anchor protein [Thermomonas sp.]
MTNRPRPRPTYIVNPGALRKGVGSWLLQRATAVVLVPLTVWFVASLIAHTGSNHAALITWLHSPLNAVLMTLLLMILFWHTALGLGVVIKDYVHPIHQKTVALIAMRIACLVFTVVGIAAVLYIVLQAS